MLVGVVAAIIIGGGVATGAGFVLTQTSDPDTSAQVQKKLQTKYNPMLHQDDIYGQR
jgi:hypothetical protein